MRSGRRHRVRRNSVTPAALPEPIFAVMKRIILIVVAGLLSACASREPLPDVVFDAPVARVAGVEAKAPPRTMAPRHDAPGTIGKSRAGRPITATTCGSGARRVYLIASIHGDESEGRSALDELERGLGSIARHATIRLVRDMNPDGTAKRTRTNAAGVDLNRNWPATNFRTARGHGKAPLSEPEAAAVHEDIAAFDPHVIVVLHSARGGPFVNYDGPASAAALAERFAAAARRSGDKRWKTVPDMGYPTPGSMGSYFGKDKQLPILTVEFKRGETPGRIAGPLLAGVAAVAADRSVALNALGDASSQRGTP